MKRSRRTVQIFLGVTLAVALGVALWPREREPEYEGKTLSEWLMTYMGNQYTDTTVTDRATNAVHHIGTNALPLLVKWTDYEMPRWRAKLTELVAGPAAVVGGRPLLRALVRKHAQAGAALAGFEILGKEAAPAVPALAGLLGDWNSESKSRSVLLALMYTGKDGLPPLVSVLTNRNVPVWFRCNAAERIGAPVMDLGTNVSWAVPVLSKYLRDDDVSAEVAETLGRFGKRAAAAVPDLIEALNSKDLLTRMNATNALVNIAPGMLKKNGH